MFDLKNYKTWIVLVVILGCGYAIGRYSSPSKIVTKTETKVVTQEVVTVKEVDKTDYYKNKVLVEIVTTKPDGTVVRERKFVDKSIIRHEDDKDTKDDKHSSTDTKSETTKTYSSNNGSIRVLVGRNLNNLSEDIYGAQVEKRILGPFTLGAFGLTDKTAGLSLGLTF